jgi:class 3 adenylate cyclase/TolB-like protein/cytochrome c-type biogenesis protein CcmH/NrfG
MPDALEESTSRKLAAIMFSDIVGFSSKLSENELHALDLLKTYETLIRVLTAKYDGKVMRLFGDFIMVDFASAVNAVKCAIELQKRFWFFGRDKEVVDRIEVRVGIHLGDVILRGTDIVGEGVTTASRIELITAPNRICISGDIFHQVKNKIPLQTFALGPLTLKDVPHPIEIYEILMESIPALAVPSDIAKELAEHKKPMQFVGQESEDNQEAQRVEEVRKKVQGEQNKIEEEHNKISAQYEKAEKLLAAGKLKEAEISLQQISSLHAKQTAPAEPKLTENDRIAAQHLTAAKKFLALGKLDTAEAEVNEIFHLFPLHAGAHQLTMQIEEAHFRLEEQTRAQQAEATKGFISDEERQVAGLLAEARSLLQQEQFQDAIFKLHDLFLLDPNHTAGRRLEEMIRQMQQEKDELQLVEAEQQEEQKRVRQLTEIQHKHEDRRLRHQLALQQVEHAKRTKRTQLTIIAVVLVIAAVIGIPRIIDWAYPKSTTLAVVHFSSDMSAPDAPSELSALPLLLSDVFSRCDNLIVIAPSSSLLYAVKTSSPQKIAAALGADYILSGTTQENRGQYSIAIKLFSVSEKQTIYTGTVEGTISQFDAIQQTIVKEILNKMDIRADVPSIEPVSQSTSSYLSFLRGLAEYSNPGSNNSQAAQQQFEQAVRENSSNTQAESYLAYIALQKFHQSDNPADLQHATAWAEEALKNNPTNGLAYYVQASAKRLSQRFENVIPLLERSIALSPQNADCYRELALSTIIGGKYDDAIKFGGQAMLHDPQNADSYITFGIAQQFNKNYAEAIEAYKHAITLGADDSLIHVQYLMSASLAANKQEDVERFCQKILRTSPNDFRYYYWMGRAYQSAVKISDAQRWLEDGLNVAQKHLERDPSNALAHAYCGLIYSRLGKFPDGEAELNKALAIDSTSATILFCTADIYSIQRNKTKAIATLQSALKRQYDFSAILNPDFAQIAGDGDFLAVINRQVK